MRPISGSWCLALAAVETGPTAATTRNQGMFLGSIVSRLATPLPVVSPGAASPAKKYRGRPLYADCRCPSGRVKTVKSEVARHR